MAYICTHYIVRSQRHEAKTNVQSFNFMSTRYWKKEEHWSIIIITRRVPSVESVRNYYCSNVFLLTEERFAFTGDQTRWHEKMNDDRRSVVSLFTIFQKGYCINGIFLVFLLKLCIVSRYYLRWLISRTYPPFPHI